MPDRLVRFVFGRILHPIRTYYAYIYDRNKFVSYSDSFQRNTEIELIGNIVKHYHVIEKGLTMPEIKKGFGQDNILKLIDECFIFIKKYDSKDPQLIHAVSSLSEYKDYHSKIDYVLPHYIVNKITELSKMLNVQEYVEQVQTNSVDYFKYSRSAFDKFSKSRKSLRNFSDKDVEINKIMAAFDIAKNYPSSCNRQPHRNYVFTDKQKIEKILSCQRGNRGFGHLTNKLIVVVGELGVYSQSFERNQVYVDGGIYLMNLLYALHFEEIGACVLNCGFSPFEDKKMRKACNVKDSEVFIGIIVCGVPADEFKVAISPKDNWTEKTIFIS